MDAEHLAGATWSSPGRRDARTPHRDSEALVAPLTVELVVSSAGQRRRSLPGPIALLSPGERFPLKNKTDQAACQSP